MTLYTSLEPVTVVTVMRERESFVGTLYNDKCESTKRCIKGRNLCVNYQFKIRCKESGDLWRNKSCNINKCFHENESQNIKMHDLIKAKEDTGDK